MADILNIAGRVHSISEEEVVTTTDEILDDSQNKKQSEINTDVVANSDDVANLKNRMSAVEALGEISVSGGDVQIANTAADIEAGSGKVPTVNAINGVLQGIGYFECTSGASAAAKVVSATGYALRSGGCMKVKMTNKNTSNSTVTLNINSTGAKALFYGGEPVSASNTWEAGEVVEIYYDPAYNSNAGAYYANNVAGGSGDGVFDISEYNKSGDPLAPTTYADLSAALNSGDNIPEGVRSGGMSVKFINSTTGKYEQCRYMGTDVTTAATFTDVSNWQGVDNEPTAGSDNLVESGGVKNALNLIEQKVNGVIIETVNNIHVPYKFEQGHIYLITNNSLYSAYVYFRIDKSSTDQVLLTVNAGETKTFTPESNFNYLYIYDSLTKSYSICIENIDSVKMRFKKTNSDIEDSLYETSAYASINSLALGNTAGILFSGRITESYWLLEEHSSHILFIVKHGDIIKITGNSTIGAQYGLLKAYPKPVNREDVQYCSGTSRVTILANAESQTTVPLDGKFLCINTNINGTDYTPASILINGKDPYFNKDVRQHLNEIKEQVNSTNNLLIENATITLAGSATSKVILNEPVLLSEDGDELELEVSTQADVNPSLGFANSGLLTNGYYSIQLGKSVIGIRAADGTWLYQSVAISTDGNIKMKILYADGKIYTYINDALKDTYNGQKNIQIASFGNGGNGTYGYWSGTIKSVKVNGTPLNLYIQNIQNAIITPVFRFLQRSDVADIDIYPRGVLKYDHTNKIFTFYSQIGKTNKYYSFKIKLDQNDNDLVYLKEWRWFGGNLCEYDGTSFSDIANTVYDAENEMAMYFKDAIDYTGGIHGDERIDVSQDSFVNFFAGGRKITETEMQSDFTVECPSFSYMQLSTLHETSKTQGEYVSGHPIVAYHYKRNTFENCSSHLENVIKMASEQTVTQYHAGMMCVGKGSGKFAILPGMVATPELSGSYLPAAPESHHSADDFSASRVDLWNPTTGARCYVEGNMVQGFDNETDIDQFEIWDRNTDSKYYRRYVDSTGKVFAANAFIRNIQKVIYY